MKVLFQPYFLVASVLYLLIRFLRFLEVDIPQFLNSYATDLLCMPIILTIILFLVQKVKRNDSIALPIAGIIFVTTYWAVYFEYYLPYRSEMYTADAVDVAMYILGMLSFILWQRKQGLTSFRSFGV